MHVHPRRPELLDVAAEVLTADPAASLGDVAAAAGIGRTTLHKRYPRREDLLLAVARDALRRIGDGVIEAGVADPTAEPAERLRRFVQILVPLGPQLRFLLQQPSLDADPELAAAVAELDAPLEEAVRRAQQAGVVRAGLAPWWVVSTLYALTYSAWEGVATGRLALLDAPTLAYDTFLAGVGLSAHEGAR